MGYVFDEQTLPRLRAATAGRERIFFVTPELAGHRDFLTGVLHYADGRSPYHFHIGCEHFYLLLDGHATLRTEAGERPIGPGTLVFIPEGQKHQLIAAPGVPLRFMEFQGPNQFRTTILEGDQDDLRWFHEDGSLWV